MSENLAALLPPVVVLILFLLVIRGLIHADRRERKAREKIEADIERRRQDRESAP